MKKPELEPLYFETHVFCCQNKREAGHIRGCCADKGAEELRNYMKDKCKELGNKVRINSSGCLDRCELGLTMVIYPEGIWYHYKDKNDVNEIISEHLQKGRIVERLVLKPSQKRL